MQQQLPPPQVVDAPGATVMVRPPVAVLPMWPEKVSMVIFPSGQGSLGAEAERDRAIALGLDASKANDASQRVVSGDGRWFTTS